jgi:hypothetical protein
LGRDTKDQAAARGLLLGGALALLLWALLIGTFLILRPRALDNDQLSTLIWSAWSVRPFRYALIIATAVIIGLGIRFELRRFLATNASSDAIDLGQSAMAARRKYESHAERPVIPSSDTGTKETSKDDPQPTL